MLFLSYAVLFFFYAPSTVENIDASAKGDRCSGLDLCKAGASDAFRTCACDEDCHKYGTCCVDADNFVLMSPHQEYQCYQDKAATPIFAKRTCSEKFNGHESNLIACIGTEPDKADVVGNLLVTSSRTKITYWNKECAICNNEAARDLNPWTVQVSCPLGKYKNLKFNFPKFIHENLRINWENGKWGAEVFDTVINCAITLYQPSKHVGQLKYCAPNMISSCPMNHSNVDASKRCSRYHGERKLKDSNVYFKNVDCALCNDVTLKQLDCVGRNYAPSEQLSGPDVVKVTYKDWEWLERLGRERYKCSEYFSYDPFWKKCRRVFWSEEELENQHSGANSAEMIATNIFFIAFSAFVIKKFHSL